MAENNGVAHLHHGGFHVQREENALLLGIGDLSRHEFAQRPGAHHAGINHLAFEQCEAVLKYGGFAVSLQFDADIAGCGHHVRLFTAIEIAIVHVRHVAFGISRPRAHRVRVLLGKRLHWCCHAAIGIAFAQNRIHRRTKHLRVTLAHRLFLISLWFLGEVRHGKAIRLQFLNGRDQLRDRGADIRQFDDVRLGRGGQFAQFGECIGNTLCFGEVFREIGENPTGERNILQLKLNTGTPGERAQDGQQRMRRQRRRFIGLGVNNLGSGHAVPLGREEVSTSFGELCKLLPTGIDPEAGLREDFRRETNLSFVGGAVGVRSCGNSGGRSAEYCVDHGR